MTKDITVTFSFKGVGHGNIAIFPGYGPEPYLQEEPGSKQFELPTGDYLLRIEGVVSIEGATLTVFEGATVLGELELPAEYFSRSLNFTVC